MKINHAALNKIKGMKLTDILIESFRALPDEDLLLVKEKVDKEIERRKK